MKLNDFTDYTLRVLMYLAVADDAPVSAQTIADKFDISFHHVAKVAQWLARSGYVSSQRGRGGGMKLAVPASQISLGAIVRATERDVAIVECLKPGPGPILCKLSPACLLEPTIREARDAFYASLDRKSLADITENRVHLRRVLDLETLPA
ncbi:MAG: Rrf2 family nitric oxide-sensitive transcriptional repressor [Paracoccaceae bacterium]|jgi:Rrf2 family nitric oxide-sensitive transcriptional repressor